VSLIKKALPALVAILLIGIGATIAWYVGVHPEPAMGPP
jgi:hypothetical protein